MFASAVLLGFLRKASDKVTDYLVFDEATIGKDIKNKVERRKKAEGKDRWVGRRGTLSNAKQFI